MGISETKVVSTHKFMDTTVRVVEKTQESAVEVYKHDNPVALARFNYGGSNPTRSEALARGREYAIGFMDGLKD
mgnify:CR=1 FL=1